MDTPETLSMQSIPVSPLCGSFWNFVIIRDWGPSLIAEKKAWDRELPIIDDIKLPNFLSWPKYSNA